MSAPHACTEHLDDSPFGPDVKIVASTKPPIVDMALHAENRARLVAALKADASDPPAPRSLILLAGGEAEMRHETDHENLFRQESFFQWTFGVRDPDCFGTVDVATGAATLFVPRLPPTYAIWMGKIKTADEWRDAYGVDSVRYVDELPAVFAAANPGCVLVLHGFNSDGKAYAKAATFKGLEAHRVDNGRLWPVICELRTVKTEREIALLRYVSDVTSEAHIAVMQHTKPRHMEYQLESVFQHWCYYHGGCRHMSYTCICASGGNGSILHYGHAGEPNSKRVKAGDLCLFDMGTEYHCYGSDVTTTFPASGTFTPDQLIVYNAVLDATYAVEDAMKPGVVWTDMQTLAYRRILTHLRDGGLLVCVDLLWGGGVGRGRVGLRGAGKRRRGCGAAKTDLSAPRRPA
jgi:Xaa-Pro dipeptidase